MTSGQLIYKGQDVSKKKIRNQLKYNKDVQMIFQDAFSSLNPRKTIYDIIAEPIRNFEKLDANTENKKVISIISGDCTLCGRCIEVCHNDALNYETKLKKLI